MSKLMDSLYKRITYLAPKRYKNNLEQQMIYAGFEEPVVEKFIGFSVLFSLFVAIVVAFVLWLFGLGLNGILGGIGSGVAIISLANISLTLIADSRAREIDIVLPDCLQLIAANIRAGMTVDKAVWLSARPEFGVLEDEIRKVGAKTLGGKPIKIAFREMSSRIKSNTLDRTVKLIIEGMESGGELAHLLEENSINIRTSQALQKEIRASVMMYSLFILFAAIIGAPLLYAISLYFVEVITKMWSPQMMTATTEAFAGGAGFIKATGPQITPKELLYFIIASLSITTFFGAIIIGLIQYGQERRGIKYIPLLMGGAFAIFLIARFVINMMFGGIFIIK